MGRKVDGVDGMRSVYLTGFMGAGKTTIGQKLAEMLDKPVYDIDHEIVKSEQRTIIEIFKKDGEEGFRELECACLMALPSEDCIITTGGGIILSKKNRQWMKEHGSWVYLHCDPDLIAKRLEKDETRPLLSGERKKNLQDLFQSRLPLYQKAPIIIDTTGMSISEAAEAIRQRIENEGNVHTT